MFSADISFVLERTFFGTTGGSHVWLITGWKGPYVCSSNIIILTSYVFGIIFDAITGLIIYSMYVPEIPCSGEDIFGTIWAKHTKCTHTKTVWNICEKNDHHIYTVITHWMSQDIWSLSVMHLLGSVLQNVAFSMRHIFVPIIKVKIVYLHIDLEYRHNIPAVCTKYRHLSCRIQWGMIDIKLPEIQPFKVGNVGVCIYCKITHIHIMCCLNVLHGGWSIDFKWK